MPYVRDSNTSSSSSEDSDVDSADIFHESDDVGSQQPSPSQYWQGFVNENADASQDDDESDYGSDNGSEGRPESESWSSDDEDDEIFDLTPAASPVAPSAAAVSHASIFV
jgi:hypothetical protein